MCCPCLVCGERDFHELFDGRMIDGHALGRCRTCGMVQASLAGESADFSYSDYGDYLLLSDDHEIQKRVHSTGQAMRSLFELISKRYNSPTVLDFGSGAGYLCRSAEDFGLNTFGVEVSEKLTEFSTNRVGFSKVYREVAHVGLRFDAIFMADVIEHLKPATSRGIMTGLLDHLNPGGLLIGNTPNIRSANILVCGDKDPVIAPPSHQCYFTRKTLDAYLCSFRLKRLRLYSKGLSSDSFFRKSKFEPSFLERSLRSTGLHLLPLVVFLKLTFRVGGILVRPWGLGYQLFFVYEKVG
jgi:2-polyprenyl-3-methyl-5-hydroxy-6-metoxy-1,4-benzoquinol methylase